MSMLTIPRRSWSNSSRYRRRPQPRLSTRRAPRRFKYVGIASARATSILARLRYVGESFLTFAPISRHGGCALTLRFAVLRHAASAAGAQARTSDERGRQPARRDRRRPAKHSAPGDSTTSRATGGQRRGSTLPSASRRSAASVVAGGASVPGGRARDCAGRPRSLAPYAGRRAPCCPGAGDRATRAASRRT